MDKTEQEKIYDESIKLLKKEGTRFTIDDLSSLLHMAKKTIYSYFPSKEELASWIYDTSFTRFDESLAKVSATSPMDWDLLSKLMVNFADILNISEESTFNRYSLNASLKAKVNSEFLEREAAIKKYLYSSLLVEMMSHVSFFTAFKSALLTFSYKENEKELIEDYLRILKESLC